MEVLMVGDIVGSAGRSILARTATRMKELGEVDAVIANAENAAGGKGMTGSLAEELFAAGVDVLTLGDHTWDQKQISDTLEHESRLLRPVNFAPGCAGQGIVTVDCKGVPLTVINAIGRVFMQNYDCPFRTVGRLLSESSDLGRVIFVDIHAEATSEKIAMGRYLDGRVSCVAGSHTHVQTSDETVLPGGTAYITDLGMTGPKDSVIGRDLESVLDMFLTGRPSKFKLGTRDVALEGVVVSVDETTGRARRIRRIREHETPS